MPFEVGLNKTKHVQTKGIQFQCGQALRYVIVVFYASHKNLYDGINHDRFIDQRY